MTNLTGQWSTRMRSTFLCVLLVLPGLAACTSAMTATDQPPAAAAADPWPRQLTSGDHTFSVFQPQYERWEQGHLDGRAAVAVESQASPQPTYGVIWFSARTQIDKEARMVSLEEVTLSKADFPTVPDGGARYLAALRQILVGQPLTIALDRLQAELEVERVEDPGRIVQVRNDPPRIIVSEAPALLLRIDGPPALRPVAGTALQRVINTRVLLVFEPSIGHYYLWLMDRWLEAPKLDGPWAVPGLAPASRDAARQSAVQSGLVDLLDNPAPAVKQLLEHGAIPQIYVSTGPAELIVLTGEPSMAPIASTDILEVTNMHRVFRSFGPNNVLTPGPSMNSCSNDDVRCPTRGSSTRPAALEDKRRTMMPEIHARRLLIASALISATTSLAASPVEAPFLAENEAAMNTMMAAMTIKPSGDVDTDFVAMMVPHHQGAIDMAQSELRYGRNEQLRRLAQEIIVTQQQEIAAMWLALGQPLSPSGSSSAAPSSADRTSTEPMSHHSQAPGGVK